MANLAHGICE